jgi:tRNA-2-methylthio-N6-dimethylallyladenosine synthase
VSDQIVQLRARRPKDVGSAVPERPAADAPRVYIETYGCQMNVADSDMLVGLLGTAGMTRTTSADEADVIVINTCAVREKAEDRVAARARELSSHKKQRNVVLAITGCMAEHLKERLAERAPHVDVIAGPDSYRRVPELINAARHRADVTAPLLDVQLDKAETYEGLSGAAGGDGVSGFVTIQRGCDKFCTFCVVPFTRGRERGTPPREVLRQVRALADAGYREAVLLGQTVNSYRYEDVSFGDLVRAVARVDGIERIRFTSPYPIDFTDDVIDAIASEPKVCEQVHLPLQSGSDLVLERMRRGYSVADYRAIVAALRARMPNIAISTDILSSFSGETEEDHQHTLALMRELRFDSAFMFMYSERDLTYAAKKLPDDIPMEVKKRRIAEIVALQEHIGSEVNQAHIGRRERVLIHARSKRRDDQLIGRTDGFKAVILPGDAGERGDFVDVEIERATMATLFGRVL